MSELEMTKEEILAEVGNLGIIHQSWKDYALFLLNTSAPSLRESWRQKFVTSAIHWAYRQGSISESNVIGLEVMSSLPNEFTLKTVDDAWVRGKWERIKRLPGSRRQVVRLGHYPMESTSNEANLCMKAIMKDWDNLNYLIFQSDYISKMWNFAQESAGKSVTQDEILTYTLERETNEELPAYFCDITRDVLVNGVEDLQYKDDYRTKQDPEFPHATGNGVEWTKRIAKYDEEGNITGFETGDKLTLEEMMENFTKFCDIALREDVSYSPSYKKLAVTVLKGDVNATYMGFSPSVSERKVRSKAMMTFAQSEKERNSAIKELSKLEEMEAKGKE